MAGLTLDEGALIAFERNDRRVGALLARALHHGCTLVVPSGVVGQVWRIDASVVLGAKARGHRIVRSGAKDLEQLGPGVELIVS